MYNMLKRSVNQAAEDSDIICKTGWWQDLIRDIISPQTERE